MKEAPVKSIPEIGRNYVYYDDGKIRETRKYEVELLEVVPFKDIDKETLKDWSKDVEECDWLYATATDFFIKAYIESISIYVVFVRTVDGEWFSLGYWAGVLYEEIN